MASSKKGVSAHQLMRSLGLGSYRTAWFLAHRVREAMGDPDPEPLGGKVGPFSSLRHCHDWDFVLRCVFFVEPLFVDEPLYKYRVHGANSFRALTSYADSKTRAVIQSCFRRVKTAAPPNRLAPAPQNWPAMFEAMARQIGRETHLKAIYSLTSLITELSMRQQVLHGFCKTQTACQKRCGLSIYSRTAKNFDQFLAIYEYGTTQSP